MCRVWRGHGVLGSERERAMGRCSGRRCDARCRCRAGHDCGLLGWIESDGGQESLGVGHRLQDSSGGGSRHTHASRLRLPRLRSTRTQSTSLHSAFACTLRYACSHFFIDSTGITSGQGLERIRSFRRHLVSFSQGGAAPNVRDRLANLRTAPSELANHAAYSTAFSKLNSHGAAWRSAARPQQPGLTTNALLFLRFRCILPCNAARAGKTSAGISNLLRWD